MTGRARESRQAAHFEALYAANQDPWNFTGSDYERHKYDLTIETLRGRRFVSGFEVGCSIGVLTQRLSRQCDALLAVDIVPTALAAAAARCVAEPQVTFAQLRVPDDWPEQKFDLIVLSEVLYFLTPADIARVARLTCETLLPAGVVLLVNYTGTTDDPCSGDEAATAFIAAAAPKLQMPRQHRGDSFRLDMLESK